MAKTLRVGGVPEHFNLPWHFALEKGLFAKRGLDLTWVDVPNGTGAMITAAHNDEVDVIVALTEGLVSEIVKGSPLRLIGTYVASPLRWGIITGANARPTDVEHLKDGVFGISRYTSGSHLMACVLALERGWHPQTLKFDVQGNFKNLREGVNSGKSDAFLWEHFTTKPFVDSGECRFLGSITTPWPCFMVAAKVSTIDTKLEALATMFEALKEACTLFHETKGMHETVAARYGLKPEDAKAWYKAVTITASAGIAQSALTRALDALYQAKVIPNKSEEVDLKSLIDPRLAELKRDLRSMKLYSKPELLKFIRNNLIARGLTSGPLDYTQLLPFDQHHYNGVPALELCSALCKITSSSHVLSLGAGFGGPARYFAGKESAQVTAVELQDDVDRLARELTQRCGLNSRVSHVCAEAVSFTSSLPPRSVTTVVSWLTLLHIPDRGRLIQHCADALVPGGLFFAEDFFELAHFTAEEQRVLEEDVSAHNVFDLLTYKRAFTSAGLIIEKAEDLSAEWTTYTRERVQRWKVQREELVKVHRPDTYARLLDFYTKVEELFKGGRLGGVRFVARKPIGLTVSQ